MKKYLIIIALLFSTLLYGQTQGDVIPQKIKKYPDYITFIPKNQLDHVLDYSKYSFIPVIYKVNKIDLIENDELKDVVKTINKIDQDVRYHISYIWVGGSASPEGPLNNNIYLGGARAKVLSNYIVKNTNILPENMFTHNFEENWDFLDKLDSAPRVAPYKDQIIKIVENEPDFAKRKTKIKALDNGKTWHYLITDVFANLRNASMVIVGYEDYVKAVEMPTLVPITTSLTYQYDGEIVPFYPEPKKDYRFWSLKTNTLFLAALCANIGFEVQIGRKFSLDVPVWYSPYDIKRPTRKIRLLATQPEFRYWTGHPGEGHFFGLHTHVVGFNVAINDRGRYQDPNHALWGLGLSYGYATHLDKAKRWGIEFTLGGGYANYKYDSYRNWLNGPRYFRSGTNHYWGLTRASIGISYKWYKDRRKGNE